MTRRFRLFLLMAVILFLCTIAFLLAAPYMANTFLLPHLLADLPVQEKQVQISRLTPWSLQSNLTLGSRENPALSLPRLHLAFSPTAIIHGKADDLLLDGATLHLVYRDGRLMLPGLDLPATAGAEHSRQPLLLPMAVSRIALRNCQLVLNLSEKTRHHITVDGALAMHYQKSATGSFQLTGLKGHIVLAGDLPLSLDIKLQPTATGPALTLSGDCPDLAALLDLLNIEQLTTQSGAARLQAQANFSKQFRRLETFTLQIDLPQLDLHHGSIHIQTPSPAPPPLLTVTGDGTQLTFTLDNLQTTGPLSTTLSLSGTYDMPTGKLNGKGFVSLHEAKGQVGFDLAGEYRSDRLQLHIASSGGPLQLHQSAVDLGPCSLAVTAEHIEQTSKALVNLQLNSLALADQQLQFHDLSLTLPFLLTKAKDIQLQDATLTIADILYRQESIASFHTRFTPDSDQLLISGELAHQRQQDLRILLSGRITADGPPHVFWHIEETAFDNVLLPTGLPLPGDLQVHGFLAAQGDLTFSPAPTGNLTISLRDTSLALTDKKILLSGINTSLTLPAIPRLASVPSQLLTIDSLEIGSLKFHDASVSFRLEDTQNLFVEKSRLHWCGGTVESGSMRLTTDRQEFATTLYCDRLKLAALLDQFGITGTEGDAALNGRLPISFSDQGLLFDDGFLFSTPGDSGIVRFRNTQILRQGIGEVGQAGYLEYALQALENFSYNWTKLTFNSHQENLLIALQIDGKPSEPLPFGYKNGQIVPVADSPGIQHPMRLDLNFHLPFAEMLKYGQNIQTIMENM